MVRAALTTGRDTNWPHRRVSRETASGEQECLLVGSSNPTPHACHWRGGCLRMPRLPAQQETLFGHLHRGHKERGAGYVPAKIIGKRQVDEMHDPSRGVLRDGLFAARPTSSRYLGALISRRICRLPFGQATAAAIAGFVSPVQQTEPHPAG